MFGSSVGRAPGIPNTAAGSNVVGMLATAYLTTGIGDTLAVVTTSESTANPSLWLVAIRGFSTGDTGSASLIHGRNIGQTIGMTMTTSLSNTTAMDIICIIAGTRAIESRSTCT